MMSLCGSQVRYPLIRPEKLPRLLVLGVSEAFDICGTGFKAQDYQ
jgi:hypothetical protein